MIHSLFCICGKYISNNFVCYWWNMGEKGRKWGLYFACFGGKRGFFSAEKFGFYPLIFLSKPTIGKGNINTWVK